jgi:hypothetical protein
MKRLENIAQYKPMLASAGTATGVDIAEKCDRFKTGEVLGAAVNAM